MSSGQEVGEIFGAGAGPATALLRSPTVIIASIGLWGMNILLFRCFNIDHVRVLNGGIQDQPQSDVINEESVASPSRVNDAQGTEVTAGKCFMLSFLLFSFLHLVSHIWINILSGSIIGATFAFYTITGICIVLPLPSTRWIRRSISVVLSRAAELVNPRCSCIGHVQPTPIPFKDVFFADAMCSLSKVFFDWGLLALRTGYYPHPVPASASSIVLPSFFAAFPYLIRARQCIVMLNIGRMKNDPKAYQHLLNAIKYSTSLFPICLSAYQKTVDQVRRDQLEQYLIVLLTINALYSYAWDSK